MLQLVVEVANEGPGSWWSRETAQPSRWRRRENDLHADFARPLATLFTFTHRLGGRRRDHDVARIAAAALALAALAAVEPHGLFGDVKVRARKSDEELKPRLFDILS